jgi:hypothetical protein
MNYTTTTFKLTLGIESLHFYTILQAYRSNIGLLKQKKLFQVGKVKDVNMAQ